MTLDETTLEALCEACKQQLQRFRLRGESDTSSCDEILRRAAAHDDRAIATLIQLSEPLVRRRYPLRRRDAIDDGTQEVLLQIVVKMRNRESPYILKPPPPKPFVAYQTFLQITSRNLAYNQIRADQRQSMVSLDQNQDDFGLVIADPRSGITELENLLRFEWIMERIPKLLDREIFRMRFALHLSTDETAEALIRQGWEVTKKQVFRSVERTIRHLSTLPEMRELFEE